MRRRTIIWLVILLAIAIVGLYAWKEYTRGNKDLANAKADIIISAVQLVKEYETSDSTANNKYLGKIIETNGIIKAVEQDERGYYTLVIGDTSSLSSVRCSMDTTHKQDAAALTTGASVSVRGNCTGFNKDDMGLGSDVILNRCVIIKQKK